MKAYIGNSNVIASYSIQQRGEKFRISISYPRAEKPIVLFVNATTVPEAIIYANQLIRGNK